MRALTALFIKISMGVSISRAPMPSQGFGFAWGTAGDGRKYFGFQVGDTLYAAVLSA